MDRQFKRVGTHSGRFHADEVMATAILKEIYDLEVVRSRDPKVLEELELVYDIGNGEFDHHQMDKRYRENNTPYAACGLIWERYGREAVPAIEPGVTEEDVEELFRYMDRMLIEGIDASDNGLRTSMTIIPTRNISAIISEFNPTWDSDISEDERFHKAVEFASTVFKNMINQQFSSIRAESKIMEAYNNRKKPEVLILDGNYPWMHTLNKIDKENEVMFVIYPRDSEYLIQSVRRDNKSYRERKLLPMAWAGKRNEELDEVIGISDAIFCHSDRFIAGAKSLDSIMKMAGLAVAEPVVHINKRGLLYSLKKLFLRRYSK